MTDSTWTRALVTGASSGIGESMARMLAADGTDLVLVARRRDRLEALAAELPVNVEVLVADLATDAGQAEVERRLVTEPAIDCLIANAGIAEITSIEAADLEHADRMIRLNVLAVARQIHVLLPRLTSAGRGGILVTSSLASFQATPYSGTYGATKAFVTSLTESVHAEVASAGIHVTALCPGPTHTEIEAANGMSVDAPKRLYASADSVAAAGLQALADNTAICVPGIGNKIGSLLPRFVPRPITRRLVATMYRRFAVN